MDMGNYEMDRLRGQRLCFNCKERWHHGHRCKPKPSLAAIEGIEGDNECQTHATVGDHTFIANPPMMKTTLQMEGTNA
nr:Retrovirus-related Pol polyprotein from transposon 17.6 [Ipomoea batatas]GMD94235.1 Retrovirus-related Pol polyprotein from transposon 17.6 [Ipomoea batatas]GME06890.1 Retrovirus-related Pol polyprotein from transposon 17.6 [Ipomoea batatas]